MVDSELKLDILVHRRGYFKDKVKAPLMKSVDFISCGKFGYCMAVWHAFQIVRLCMKYPEPTRENCKNPDSIVMLDTFEEFFKWERNEYRDPFFKLVRRIVVGTLEHCDYDSQRISWFLMKLTNAYMEGRWKPHLPCTPFICWNDPEVIKAKEEAIEETVMELLRR
uniref:Uncharacterized protein n=1 Tax=viral metagenome TaxID=1070528 RepID=A0A6M3LIU3_9ZZZZ